MNRLKVFPIILFVFVLTSLACNLSFGGQATPEAMIPVATEAVEEQFTEPPQNDEIEIVFTESQLTSLLSSELADRVGDQITNLQVFLRDGQIQIFGDLDSQGLSAQVKVIAAISVDPAGRPVLNVVSSSIGPFPVPAELISEVEVRINKAFQEEIQSMAPNMHVDDIIIENGKMIITGRSK
jgi:uncharacterized protein YpmS